MTSDDYLRKVSTISEHIVNYTKKMVENNNQEIKERYAEEIYYELHRLRRIQTIIYCRMVLDENKN